MYMYANFDQNVLCSSRVDIDLRILVHIFNNTKLINVQALSRLVFGTSINACYDCSIVYKFTYKKYVLV